MPEQEEEKLCDECGERPGQYDDGDRLLCKICEYKAINEPTKKEDEAK